RPPLLDPPRIKAGVGLAGHAAGTGQQSEIGTQVSSNLSESRRVKVPTGVIVQLPEIDVDRRANAVPAEQLAALLADDVPKRVADVVKVDPNAAFEPPRSCTAPVSK